MAVRLIEIVNPNGRKGLVAETSLAAAVYKQPPSKASRPTGVKKAASSRSGRPKKTGSSAARTTSPESKED